MTGITESCVHECREVHGSDLIEQVKCNLGSPDRLLLWIYEVLCAQYISFVKVHHTNVIKCAEYVEMDLRLCECCRMVERIVPCQFQIVHYHTVILVPVQMLTQHQRILCIHLCCWNKLIQHVQCRVWGKLELANLIP